MALLKHFYTEVSKEEKRVANLQVDLMMEMLQEDLDPPDLLNESKPPAAAVHAEEAAG